MSHMDISAEIEAICAKFDLDKRDVARIELWPTHITFDVLLTNEHGSKYLNEDGDVAMESQTHRVTT